jgi:hypothetical protein
MQHLFSSKILACPKCRNVLAAGEEGLFCTNAACWYSKDPFPEVNGKPVLVDFDQSVIQYAHLKNTEASSLVKRTVVFFGIKKMIKKLLSGSNHVSACNFKKLDELMSHKKNPVILIVGGGTVGAGGEKFIEKIKTLLFPLMCIIHPM